MLLDRSLISELPAFAGLANGDLDSVLATARSSRYQKDSEIYAQAAVSEHFFLLLSGHIRLVFTTPEGELVTARYIDEGELFGIAVAMGQKTCPASAIPAVDCVVLRWPNAAWPDLLSRFPVFGATIYRMIGVRHEETQARVVEMSTQQAEQRIAGAVLRLVRQSGRKTLDGIEIDFPISRQDIAEMTGSTMHTVSRLLSSWEEEGIVRSGRQKVTVTAPHALMLLAENRRRK